jgi:hypothetical protein
MGRPRSPKSAPRHSEPEDISQEVPDVSVIEPSASSNVMTKSGAVKAYPSYGPRLGPIRRRFQSFGDLRPGKCPRAVYRPARDGENSRGRTMGTSQSVGSRHS